jgi:hypothetical protein
MDEAEDEFNALRHIVRQKRNRTDWRDGRKQGVTDSVLADPAAQIGAQIIGQTLDRASGEIQFGVKQDTGWSRQWFRCRTNYSAD